MFRALSVLALLGAGCASGAGSDPTDGAVADATTPIPDAAPIDAPAPDARPLDATVDAHIAVCTEGDTNRTDTATGHCYMLFAAPINWQGARTGCTALMNGAHFVSINSAAEQTIVAGLVGARRVWIGASDALTEGTFTWANGDQLVGSYQNWQSGEPNNDGDEDCAELNGTAAGAAWNDNKCTNTQGYVCERD